MAYKWRLLTTYPSPEMILQVCTNIMCIYKYNIQKTCISLGKKNPKSFFTARGLPSLPVPVKRCLLSTSRQAALYCEDPPDPRRVSLVWMARKMHAYCRQYHLEETRKNHGVLYMKTEGVPHVYLSIYLYIYIIYIYINIYKRYTYKYWYTHILIFTYNSIVVDRWGEFGITMKTTV